MQQPLQQSQQPTQPTYSAFNPEQSVDETPATQEQVDTSVEFITPEQLRQADILAAQKAVELELTGGEAENIGHPEATEAPVASEQVAYVNGLSKEAQTAAQAREQQEVVPSDAEAIRLATENAHAVLRARQAEIFKDLENAKRGDYALAA